MTGYPGDTPAVRAAIDQGAAAAVDAILQQARSLSGEDPAVAVHHLGMALCVTQSLTREELALVLSALAVHHVREGAEQ